MKTKITLILLFLLYLLIFSMIDGATIKGSAWTLITMRKLKDKIFIEEKNKFATVDDLRSYIMQKDKKLLYDYYGKIIEIRLNNDVVTLYSLGKHNDEATLMFTQNGVHISGRLSRKECPKGSDETSTGKRKGGV